MSNKKEYNTSLIAVWTTKNGNAMSMKVDERALTQIRTAMEKVTLGSKLLVKFLTPERKAKFPNPDNAPDAFIEVMSADSVAEFESRGPTPTAGL